jgi:hypothetical protein
MRDIFRGWSRRQTNAKVRLCHPETGEKFASICSERIGACLKVLRLQDASALQPHGDPSPMFNSQSQRKEEPVQLVLSDGRVVPGTLLLPITSEVRRALNGDSATIEFLHADGRLSLVAKQAIVEIVLVKENQAGAEAVAA